MGGCRTYPNVVFEVDDLERDWTYRENQFDFIHSRMVGTAIKDWPRYVSQMFKHTRPGGLVEISEHQFNAVADDDSIPPNSPISRYLDALQDGLEKVGLPVKNFTPEFFVDLLKEAGFVDVQVRTFRVPWGKWAKNKDMKYLGAVVSFHRNFSQRRAADKCYEQALEVFTSGAEAYALQVFTSVLGIKEDEAKKMCEEGLAKIRTNKEHRFHYQWQIVGRKPRAEEVA